MCTEETSPREKIHRHLKSAGEHVKKAGDIAREAGDNSGADDFGGLGTEIKTRTDKFDVKKGM